MEIKIIKPVIEESGRLEEVINILKGIISDKESSYPVGAYVNDNNETVWRVNGETVRKEAVELLKVINQEVEETEEDFYNLLQYVKTEADILLHNYSIAIAHRIDPDIDMEDARRYLIVENLIECWILKLAGNPITYSIPDGWKNQVSDESGWTAVYTDWDDGKEKVARRFKTSKEKEEFLDNIRKPGCGFLEEEIESLYFVNDYNYMLPQ